MVSLLLPRRLPVRRNPSSPGSPPRSRAPPTSPCSYTNGAFCVPLPRGCITGATCAAAPTAWPARAAACCCRVRAPHIVVIGLIDCLMVHRLVMVIDWLIIRFARCSDGGGGLRGKRYQALRAAHGHERQERGPHTAAHQHAGPCGGGAGGQKGMMPWGEGHWRQRGACHVTKQHSDVGKLARRLSRWAGLMPWSSSHRWWT